jgi:ATP-dependent DNA ligase
MGPNKYDLCVNFLVVEVKNWSSVKIMVFDAPQATDLSYANRLEQLKQSKLTIKYLLNILGIPDGHPILSVVKPIIFQSKAHLNTFFNQIRSSSGEGIILRDPNAWYYQRNAFLSLKVRTIGNI